MTVKKKKEKEAADIGTWWFFTRKGARYLICDPVSWKIKKGTGNPNLKDLKKTHPCTMIITPLQYIKHFMDFGNFAQRVLRNDTRGWEEVVR